MCVHAMLRGAEVTAFTQGVGPSENCPLKHAEGIRRCGPNEEGDFNFHPSSIRYEDACAL